jgi:hypothetical protein
MCVEWDPLALRVRRIVRVLELGGPSQRRAGHAVAADHLLLLEHPDPVPELDVLADRADDHVGPARRERGLVGVGPDELSHQRWIGHVGVGGAVAEGEQVARGRVRIRVAPGGLERIQRPPWRERTRHHPHQLARRVHDRVALAGADLHQQVAVGPAGVEAIERERAHRGQVARLLRCQPVAVIEQRRAERERDRQRIGRGVASEDAGVRRRVVDLLDADRRAPRQLANAGRQLLQ